MYFEVIKGMSSIFQVREIRMSKDFSGQRAVQIERHED